MCVKFVFYFLFFIFVSAIAVWGSNTASILFNSILIDEKVNLVGAFPIVFKSAGKKKQKLMKNCNFYAKWGFNKIDFGFWCNPKTNNRRYMKFLLNVYIGFFYT